MDMELLQGVAQAGTLVAPEQGIRMPVTKQAVVIPEPGKAVQEGRVGTRWFKDKKVQSWEGGGMSTAQGDKT